MLAFASARHLLSPHRRALLVAAAAVGGLLVPAGSASASSKVPSHNLTSNPSFRHHTRDWSGFRASVKRVRTRKAPDGRYVAKVTADKRVSDYTIDGTPPAVGSNGHAPTKNGARYRASAFVRASRASAGRRVGLVVRETDASGRLIGDHEHTVRLSRRHFKKVRVHYTAQASGDHLDVYVRRASHVSRHDSFSVDAISLVRTSKPGGGNHPPNDPPPSDPPPTDPNAPSPVTTSQIANTTPDEQALFDERGSNYQTIIVRDSTHAQIATLRAANPGARILVYKNLSFINVQPKGCPWTPFQGSGVPWCNADSHESWFLHDANGNRIESDFKGSYAANIANPGYQQAWIDAVAGRLADINADGSNQRYDGVFIDDSNLYPGHGMDGRIAELNDSAYGKATQQFIDRIGDELGHKGFMTVPNLALDLYDSTQRSEAMTIASHVTTINRESFIRWGRGSLFTSPPSNGTANWRDQVKFEQDVEATGASFSAIAYGSENDVQAQRYARASFLLGWNGQVGSSIIYRPTMDSSSDTYTPNWTTNVGTPTGSMTAVGQGFRRDFTAGTVVINPAPSGSQSFDLGGSYELPDGSCTSSVTLGAVKALALPACPS